MKKDIILTVLILAVAFASAAVAYKFVFKKFENNNGVDKSSEINNKNMETNKSKNLITLKTNFGEVQFQTYDADAPKASENFVSLAQKGFYNNLIFHRVIKGFMIQGGDPNCDVSADKGSCGAGGPGYKFDDELNPNAESYKEGYKKGVVAMANSGPNTNGSQFFIMLENYPLPNNYTIFGKVVKGQEIVDAIGNTKTNANDRPVEPIIIKEVKVEQI